MSLTGIAATHVHCFECDKFTPIEEGESAAETACWHCEDDGKDGHAVEPVAVIPCPAGVTAREWAVGYPNGGCDDDVHEHRTGNHIIAIERG